MSYRKDKPITSVEQWEAPVGRSQVIVLSSPVWNGHFVETNCGSVHLMHCCVAC